MPGDEHRTRPRGWLLQSQISALRPFLTLYPINLSDWCGYTDCHAHYKALHACLHFKFLAFDSQLERRLHRQVGFVPRSMCTLL